MRLWAFILVLFLALPAHAQMTPGARNFGRVCTGGGAFCSPVPFTPTRFYDFTTGTLPLGVTFTRSGTAWYFNSSGLLASAGTNTPRFDYGTPGSSTLIGMLVEPGVVNKALYSRDLTNAVWSLGNATSAMDQTGIDGVVSSASSLTATANNATVCQPITQAATASVFSVYLKRISGSGTISISQDGSTYTTTVLTSSWQRFSHTSQSTLNPTLCIQIATSGDVIAVDVAQFESSAIAATSPIITTSAQVTRSTESATVSGVSSWYNINSGAAVIEWRGGYCGSASLWSAGFGPGGSSTLFHWENNNGNIGTPTTGSNCGVNVNNGNHKSGATYGAKFFDAATDGTLCAKSIKLTVVPTSLNFGNTCSSWIKKFTYWNYPLTATQLQGRT